MNREAPTHKGFLLIGGVLGCLVGMLIAADRAENDRRGRRAATDCFSKWGVTAQDLQTTQLLNEQERRGEFVLQNEKPPTKKFIECDLREIAANAAAERSPEYFQVFTELGITPEVSDRLQRHLAKIHLASLEAEVAIQQVLDARLKYDQQLRKLLGEQEYGRYRQYELRKPAIREYENLRSAAAEEGILLDPAFQAGLVDMLQQVQAYTRRSWHGPFDGLPDGVVGENNVIEQVSKERLQLSEKVRQLILIAEEQQLPESLRVAISKHFSTKMDEMQAAIDGLRKPIEASAQ